jgi:hypothetical protein
MFFFFNTFYHLTAVVDFPNLLGFYEFLDRFSISS